VACVAPTLEQGDSGTQIGSEDCGMDLIVVTLRDEANNGLEGEVVYVYEDDEPVTLSCLYTCYIDQARMGAYHFTATVQDTVKAEEIIIDDDDLSARGEKCPPYFEVTVAFEFNGLS
jgi:hypothetical protein